MTKKLVIGYFYKEYLNLYGDTGNVDILVYRALKRGYDAQVVYVSTDTPVTKDLVGDINLIFMGGGPDSGQKGMYDDLYTDKKSFLHDFVESENPALFICGSYQLLGNYYKSNDGKVLDGLGIFDLYTQHFGKDKPRCIGNTLAKLNDQLLNDSVFKQINKIGQNIVGFENHGGRTYLGEGVLPFAQVIKGYGNNAQDKTEGVLYKNSIGTYFHGPLLSKNPHIADFLLAKALKLSQDETANLASLDDSLILTAHKTAQMLKQ